MQYTIREASAADVPDVAAMAIRIWHSSTAEELTADFISMISSPGCGLYIAFKDGIPAGFAQCGLRHDYVEGTHSSPVGYLEGIYVKPEYRSCGCAKMLLAACENWAREQNCQEFASDCELDNRDSLGFHLGVGFTEANRIICFTKKL